MLIYWYSSIYVEKQEFKTIFTSNDVINIQYVIKNGFGYRERAHYMVVNDYFGPIRTK